MNRSLKNIAALFYIAKSSIKKTTLVILALLNIQSARFSMSEEKEPVVRNDDVQTSLINANLQTLCWSISAILLSFLCLMHLGVMLSFAFGWSVSFSVVPIALFFALVVGDWLAWREGLRGMLRIVPPVIGMTVLTLALFLAASFFDMSWDGLWYHQTAVYQMSHGWNPIYDPMHSFVPHLQDWLRHYAKGPWYVALALFETTHDIETAKAAPWIALMAAFFAVFAASMDFGMRRYTAFLIAVLVSLNPVVTCQLASFLVDGLMISFLSCFIAAMFRWFRRPSLLVLIIAVTSAILCINTKFTGLVYLCFFCAAGAIYILIWRRNLLRRYSAIQIMTVLVGTVIFGFNPYVTNTINRCHPFYPLQGTAAYPSFSQRGQDPIEIYETPHNMAGRSRFIRFAYAIFGRPGSQPFYQGENAQLMWPFDVGWKDFNIFYFHEVRISGFGPLFSGALLIGLILLGIALIHGGIPREIIILFIGAIILSVLISKHTWWARYGPQFWWLPVIAVISGLFLPHVHRARWIAYALAAILLVNASLVAIAHFRWEIEATHATYEQMSLLRQIGVVNIDFQYFQEPFSERLRTGGVSFRAVRRLQCDNPMELMSVAPGYPGAVRVCISNE